MFRIIKYVYTDICSYIDSNTHVSAYIFMMYSLIHYGNQTISTVITHYFLESRIIHNKNELGVREEIIHPVRLMVSRVQDVVSCSERTNKAFFGYIRFAVSLLRLVLSRKENTFFLFRILTVPISGSSLSEKLWISFYFRYIFLLLCFSICSDIHYI